MPPRRHSALAGACVLLLAACSSNPSPGGTTRTDRRVATEAELREAQNAGNATMYDFVISRHNDWTQPRLTGVRGQMTAPTVWLDRQRLGGIEQLRTIPINIVIEARFLTPPEAQGELGLDNLGGAIVVRTRR
jgi:hypothetical protein